MNPRPSASTVVTFSATPVASAGTTDDTPTATRPLSGSLLVRRVSSRRTGTTGWKPPTAVPAGVAVGAAGAGAARGTTSADTGAATSGAASSAATAGAKTRMNQTRIPSIPRQDRHEVRGR